MENITILQMILSIIVAIGMFLGICTMPIGMILLFAFKKPVGRKLTIFGALSGYIGFLSWQIMAKAYGQALLSILFFVFIGYYLKRKSHEKY